MKDFPDTGSDFDHVLFEKLLRQFSMGVADLWQEKPLNWFEASKAYTENKLTQKTVSITHPTLPVKKEGGQSPCSPLYQKTNLYQSLQEDYRRAHVVTPSVKEIWQSPVDLKNCQTLQDIIQEIESFEGCALKKSARHTVIWDGNPTADILLIGEAPGEQEDRLGKPFVGRSGHLLDSMLKKIGRSRTGTTPETSVMMTNTVFWRPPANRVPSDIEVLACSPFLHRLIEIIKPKVIVTIGGSSSSHLLKTNQGIMKLRGKWHTLILGELSFPVLPTLHPAYLLRTPLAKKQVWSDFRLLKRSMIEHSYREKA